MHIVRYSHNESLQWNEFVATARNGLFLFDRKYMDYHADRFVDHSLLFLNDEDELIAVMPADERDHVLRSHAGLTFGGILTSDSFKTNVMLSLFESLSEYLKKCGIKRLIYKASPHIYHTVPCEDDLYALFRQGAHLYRRDVSATIDLTHRLGMKKGRKSAIKRSQTLGIDFTESRDFLGFIQIATEALQSKYDKKPTHTGEELELLASRFPDAIRLFAAIRKGEMLGGVVIYESAQVAHAQYIAANPEGKADGAIDGVLDYLLNSVYQNKKYFDFGISTEDDGRYFNEGLASYKESFGARAIVFDSYSWEIPL